MTVRVASVDAYELDSKIVIKPYPIKLELSYLLVQKIERTKDYTLCTITSP